MQYQYIEIDPYKKPQALLDVNPRGLIPAIRHGNWGCGESTVLMEYVSFSDLALYQLTKPYTARGSGYWPTTPFSRRSAA
jgi:glutathione S-transferase